MRLAVVNFTGRRYGGAENYLAELLPVLHDSGHTLAFLHEFDVPEDRAAIPLPLGTCHWSAQTEGISGALHSLRGWNPELIFAHGPLSPSFEDALLQVAPAIYFSHNYYGTCISGVKTHQFPVVRPCHRQFGWQCLALYLPRRCGGLNPVTMVSLYSAEKQRLERLRKYQAIVTHSEHMRQEYLRHGFPPDRVFPYLTPSPASSAPQPVPALSSVDAQRSGWRLLFTGRFDKLKGGSVFLDALPLVAQRLGVPLTVTFAGEGQDRPALERKAAGLHSDRLTIRFSGWLNADELTKLVDSSDLQVVPSVWPEPFGKVGPEAGLRGLPVAAFAVGGIPEWLIDGINGHLASGDPPTAEGLAGAIARCLESPGHHAMLRSNAQRIARRFSMEHHYASLARVLDLCVKRSELSPSDKSAAFS